MSEQVAIANAARRTQGYLGVAALALGYVTLYALNYWVPAGNSNYTSRIWNWSQMVLMILAGLALILSRRHLRLRTVLMGLLLAALSTLSHGSRPSSILWSLQEGVAVWLCFSAGVVLFQENELVYIPALQPPLANLGTSILTGILLALPLAVINNLYFYLAAGGFRSQNLFISAFEALSPAIHEEIVFRFFLLALILHLLKYSTSHRLAMAIAIFLSVVPHSLNHLPDLLLENPLMGCALLAATSLLFGLPMALLQIRRNLETAMSFHWFIDFARFLFGF